MSVDSWGVKYDYEMLSLPDGTFEAIVYMTDRNGNPVTILSTPGSMTQEAALASLWVNMNTAGYQASGLLLRGFVAAAATPPILTPPPPPPPGFFVVQEAHGGFAFGGTSGTATFNSNVTAGNTIVVAWTFRETQNQVPSAYTVSVNDSLSTSYNKQTSQANYDVDSRNHVDWIFSGTAGGSGSNTVTVSVSAGLAAGNCKGGAIFMYEVSGLNPAAEATGGGFTNGGGGTVTTSKLSWSDTPFLVSVLNGNDLGSATLTPSNSNYSVQTDNSANDSFGSLYTATVAASAAIGLSDNFACRDNLTAGGFSELAAAFSYAAVPPPPPPAASGGP